MSDGPTPEEKKLMKEYMRKISGSQPGRTKVICVMDDDYHRAMLRKNPDETPEEYLERIKREREQAAAPPPLEDDKK